MQAFPPAAPLSLAPNFVWRSYAGGSRLRGFRGQAPSADDHFPEDWLASTVAARNGANSQGPGEGISRVEVNGELRPLPDLLASAPEAFWGRALPRSGSPAASPVLIKLLDSGVRLQIQAHPDREFAKARLNSAAGKTECWYILETRGEAAVYLGFQRLPSRAEWARMLAEQDIPAMLACFEEIPARAGDCFVVPAGTPHAIGAGILMVELQEPADWVVRCEATAAGLTLPPAARYMGLPLEECLDVFHFRQQSVAEVRERLQQRPRLLREDPGARHEDIISAEYRDFFRLERLRGHGAAEWQGAELQVLVITRGAGTLHAAAGESRPIRAGETWLLPGRVADWRFTPAEGPWEILLAKPPLP
jgi:mannose-6-phosphate isomerase